MPLTHHISRSTWYVLVVIYMSMFAAVGVTMVYANRTAEVNNRRWCTLLVTLDDGYRAHPPVTDTGRQTAAAIASLRRDFRCRSAG